jgi:hypothetical protein
MSLLLRLLLWKLGVVIRRGISVYIYIYVCVCVCVYVYVCVLKRELAFRTCPSPSKPSSWFNSSINVRWISRSAEVPSLKREPPMASTCWL